MGEIGQATVGEGSGLGLAVSHSKQEPAVRRTRMERQLERPWGRNELDTLEEQKGTNVADRQ